MEPVSAIIQGAGLLLGFAGKENERRTVERLEEGKRDVERQGLQAWLEQQRRQIEASIAIAGITGDTQAQLAYERGRVDRARAFYGARNSQNLAFALMGVAGAGLVALALYKGGK